MSWHFLFRLKKSVHYLDCVLHDHLKAFRSGVFR
jgi:hypothetical protein